MNNTIHITNSLSALGGMRLVGIDDVMYHSLSFQDAIHPFITYAECRQKWCQTFLYDGEADNVSRKDYIYPLYRIMDGEFLPIQNLEELEKPQCVSVWASHAIDDHLMVAQIIKFFSHCTIALHEFYDNGAMGEIPCEKFKISQERTLDDNEKQSYLDLYDLMCHPDPLSIMEKYHALVSPILKKGVAQFYTRLPTRRHGLNACDLLIMERLSHYADWISEARIIGEVMVADHDVYCRFNQGYIEGRLKMLQHSNKPCVDNNGEGKIILNDFGKKLLSGGCSWLDRNPLHDRVGGIVLDSSRGQMIFQEDLVF